MPNTQIVRIGDYCTVVKGKIGIKKATPGKYPLVTTAEERSSHNECHFDKPSVIIPLVSSTGHGHASLKRIHYQEGKFAVGSILCTVLPKDENVLDAKFLYHYLDVYKEKLLVSRMKGMANVTLSVDAIKEVKFPLLSIEKQLDWIRLFEKTTFYTGNISTEISHQQKLLKKLRQSILQDAIYGKLTKKWRKENPDAEIASELLKRIKEEKERLVKEKKMKKQKPLPLIKEDEIPFELPDGWVWCRLGEITSKIGSGSTPRGGKSAYTKEGIPFLRSQNVYDDGLRLDDVAYIPDVTHKKMSGTVVFPKDVLLNITGGSIGRTSLISNDFVSGNVSQHVCIIRPIIFNSKYLHNLIISRYFQQLIPEAVTGAGREGLPKNKLELFIFPLPPEAETEQINNKVSNAMEYCDQLEYQTTQSQLNSELLMQAVLKEVFEG